MLEARNLAKAVVPSTLIRHPSSPGNPQSTRLPLHSCNRLQALNLSLSLSRDVVQARSDDGTALTEAIFSAVHSLSEAAGQQVPVVGHIAREAPEGKLLETWAEKLDAADFQLGDDDAELLNVKRAAHLMANVLKNYVVPKLESVIDEEKKATHSSLMDETEKAILDPSRAKVKLKVDGIDTCYPPIFQSEGEFDLRAHMIICTVRSRHNSYCSNCARTFLIDANPLQSEAYEVLLKAHEAAITMLKPGSMLIAAFQAASSVSAGTAISLEFRESGSNINAENERIIKGNMVFNVSLGFQNLQYRTNDQKNENISMLLADTVVVGKEKSDVATHMSSKAVKVGAYSFNEGEEEEERPKAKPEANGVDAFMSKTTRSIRQNWLVKKNEETAWWLAGGRSGAGDNRNAAKASTYLVAYKSVNDLPTPRDSMIQVDQKNGTVLFPSYGRMVHRTPIATAKFGLFLMSLPAEKEMITLLRFHLHNRITVGNRKTKDVQCNLPMTLMRLKRSTGREIGRQNLKKDFQNFVNRVIDLWGQPQSGELDLEFNQPLRELGFHGVRYKASAFTVPTSTCLVEPMETPFLVVTLSEIDIVNLERVGLAQKNFDMTIVFEYFKSRLNLNWRQILKNITDDPQSFIDDGGSEEDSEEGKGKTWEELEREASNADREKGDESDSDE
ncbi:hypothetical protein ACJRO7_004504 [Eucalyptus globulus]|uniref:FACT complex subunit n=1 Tax=Eucalyptus globulus TaxID=34317 RepID=A0ABD3J1J7_EUCGL